LKPLFRFPKRLVLVDNPYPEFPNILNLRNSTWAIRRHTGPERGLAKSGAGKKGFSAVMGEMNKKQSHVPIELSTFILRFQIADAIFEPVTNCC